MRLETPRLVLVPHTRDNLAMLLRWDNDAELLHLNSEDEHGASEADAGAMLERWMDLGRPDVRQLAIRRRSDDVLVGTAVVAFIDPVARRCKVGLTIGERSLWGQGLGTEALRRLVAFCFDELELRRIAAEIYAFNTRSIRLFESVGFVREGVRSRWRVSGRSCGAMRLVRGETRPPAARVGADCGRDLSAAP